MEKMLPTHCIEEEQVVSTRPPGGTDVDPVYVSIVLPTFDRAATVGRAIGSVLSQTHSCIELIVVDDGSTDETPAVAASFADARLRYIRQENAGVSAARNAGIAAARGTFVAFLDSDDEASPNWIEKMIESCSEPDVALVSAGVRRVSEPSGVENVVLPQPMGAMFDSQSDRVLFLAGAFLIRRDVLVEAGGYVQGLPGGENTELFLRVIPCIRARQLEIRSRTEPLVTIYSRAEVRTRSDPRFEAGAEYIVRHHREQLERQPDVLARYLAIVGVGAARAGRYSEARRYFASAIHKFPSHWKNWARLIAATWPPIARRLW